VNLALSWPVFIVEDHPETPSFVVAIDDHVGTPAAWQVNDPAALTARRQWPPRPRPMRRYVAAIGRTSDHGRGDSLPA
jgi:hypothetical protein